jgi:hypothetical protein
MKTSTLIVGGVTLVAALVLTPMAGAQWVRPGDRFGGGYQQGGYPPPGGYPPAGGYAPGGYPPPGSYPPPGGYPPQGYPPPGGYTAPAGYPPQGAYAPPPAGGVPMPGPPTPYAYPQKGQSPQQVTTDQNECGTWATQQSGYNPGAAAAATPVYATSPGESVGLFGGVTRRWDRREARWERRGWDAQGSSSGSSPQQADGYNRAIDACLSARGYAVR